MPYHRIPRKDAPELVPVIEANGEIVVAAWVEGDHYAVWTQPVGAVVDTGNDVVFKPVRARDVDIRPAADAPLI